jgi:hypothetical protein
LPWSIVIASIAGEAPAHLMSPGVRIREDLVVTKVTARFHARIGFAHCVFGASVFQDNKDSATIDVTIASLDDPTPFAPQKVIFLEDKLPWVTIDKLLPAFPKTPKTE